jgi:hypothetical protein
MDKPTSQPNDKPEIRSANKLIEGPRFRCTDGFNGFAQQDATFIDDLISLRAKPVEFKPIAKKKEAVERLILSSSCPRNYLRNKC